MERRLLRPSEVGEIFGVKAETLRRWVRRGLLREYRTLGGHRRYDEAEVEALREARTTERRDD